MVLWKRVLSALLGIPIVVLAVWYGGLYLFFLTALILLLGLREMLHMLFRLGLKPEPLSAYIGGGIILFEAYAYGSTYSLNSLTAIILIYLLTVLFSREQNNLAGISATFFSTLYIGLITYIYLLRNLPNGWIWLIFLLACTWANDTAAYLMGKKFGRIPLAPRISPRKTREGAVFGIMSSLLTAYLFTLIYPTLPLFSVLVLGVIVAVAGQIGDLVESSIKREAGIKDTGRLIPGHGGILDRFDSMLFAAPLVYHYVGLFIIS